MSNEPEVIFDPKLNFELPREIGPFLEQTVSVSVAEGLADLDAELEQFAVDAGGAPERVGQAHPADQITDLGAHLGPPQTA